MLTKRPNHRVTATAASTHSFLTCHPWRVGPFFRAETRSRTQPGNASPEGRGLPFHNLARRYER